VLTARVLLCVSSASCFFAAAVLQCVALCCNVLQCVALCCSVLQCVAVCCVACCSVLVAFRVLPASLLQVCCSQVQGVAVRCSSVLQDGIVLQCVLRCVSST